MEECKPALLNDVSYISSVSFAEVKERDDEE